MKKYQFPLCRNNKHHFYYTLLVGNDFENVQLGIFCKFTVDSMSNNTVLTYYTGIFCTAVLCLLIQPFRLLRHN